MDGRRSGLGRHLSRRRLLAGSAAVAAAAATGTLVVLESQGGSNSDTGLTVTLTPAAAAGKGTAGAAPGGDLAAPISDPRVRAAHLLRRAGFGGTKQEVEEFAALSREEAASRLVDYDKVDNSALDERLAKAGLAPAQLAATTDEKPGRLVADMQRWWLTRMAYSARPLEERMTLIWHGLLTSQVSTVGPQRARLLLTQNELFRSMALAPYDDLVKAVSKDPAMMVYLDTVESSKEHPNENYARELMELFTLGVGNYTEDDVRESARAFTGWRITLPPKPAVDLKTLSPEEQRKAKQEAFASYDPKFVFAPRQHDSGEKTFLGQTGAWDGDDIVDIIMKQPAAGRFIVTRLFRELAYDNPTAATIERLVGGWGANGHSMREVVRAILVSDEFNSQAAYRARVRSPIDFVVQPVRALGIETDFRAYPKYGPLMDQVLFEPPNVAGWPGGATWLSSSTFFARANYLDTVLAPARGRAADIPALRAASDPRAVVDAAVDLLLDGNVSDAAREALYAYAAGASADERAAGVAYLALASPDYQLM